MVTVIVDRSMVRLLFPASILIVSLPHSVLESDYSSQNGRVHQYTCENSLLYRLKKSSWITCGSVSPVCTVKGAVQP